MGVTITLNITLTTNLQNQNMPFVKGITQFKMMNMFIVVEELQIGAN